MALDERLIAWVREAMEPIGPVTMRRMMGGATLYCGGTIFAIVADGSIWFKADGDSDAFWDAAGAERFSFAMRDGRSGSMNYRRAPDTVYDDADALREYAGHGIAAGARNPPKRRRTKA